MSQTERVVVVGAGLAGLRSAERLRELGFTGELVIIGAEVLPPYHRPALSKQLLTGAMRPNDLMLPAYQQINAKWRLGTTASWLVPSRRVVHLPGGEEIGYDGLIIATGVEAKRPNNVPYYDNRIMMMRTLPDALNLERAIGSSRGPVAVVGGGFTGCEIAASLRHMGREVTIIGRSKTLLGNVLGPKLGDWLTNLHREHGVDLALGTSVKQWAPGSDGIGLYLSDGTSLLASCVVIAAGTEPSTGWLRGSGLPLDNGVVCEATCHVVGAEDVVAAGDVAQWPNIRFDSVPRRIEHWLNAVEMGRAAAESLLAGRSAAAPFTPMPRFWTEQYGIRIQAGGVPKLGTETITLGTPDDGTGTLVGYIREGKLMGVVGVDCPSSVLTWTENVCQENPAPARQDNDPPTVPAITPASAPAQAPAPATPPPARGGRHSIPAKPKKSRTKRANATNTRLSPATDSSTRLRPTEVAQATADSADPLGPLGSSTRIRPIPARIGAAASNNAPGEQDPASSNQLRPVGGPDTGARMRPVGAPDTGARIRPVSAPDTGARIRPVPPSGDLPGRVPPAPAGRGPTDSNSLIPPVLANARPLHPMDINNRLGPTDSSSRIPPAHTNGRTPPAPSSSRIWPANGHLPNTNGHPRPNNPPHSNPQPHPLDLNSRLNPLDSTTAIPPVRANGPTETNSRVRPVNGRPGPATNGRMQPLNGRPVSGPLESSGGLPPVHTNGHTRGPVETNGRVRPVNGRPGPATNGRMQPPNGRPVNGAPGPLESTTAIPPVRTNGHQHGPAETNGRVRPVNGRSGPADTNGRMVPPNGRPVNGRSGPLDSSSMPPARTNGHQHGPAETNGRVRPVNGRSGPETNGHSHGPAETNGREYSIPPARTNGHHSSATNGRVRQVLDSAESSGRIPAVEINGRHGSNGHPTTNGAAAESETNGKRRNGRHRSVESSDVVPLKKRNGSGGRHGAEDSNGRLRPLDLSRFGRHGEQQGEMDMTGRIPPVKGVDVTGWIPRVEY
jgi:NADPH-dependent 2,4-dienoyl-CoA reductase/sulfur reductase-like enzyme